MGAVTLMALNRPFIRFLEGYGALNPLRILLRRKRRVFDQLASANARLRKDWDEADLVRTPFPHDRQRLYVKLITRAVEKFPDSRDYVLPTAFGNAIRAFEVYPRVIYGLEGIHGWYRLTAVIPADYRQGFEDAKAQVDFWVNLWISGLIATVLYGIFCSISWTTPYRWIPVATLVIAFVSARGAFMATTEWGMLFMSAFDLYRGELCKKLGLRMPRSVQDERVMWLAFSQMVVYRSKEATDRLSRYRDTADVAGRASQPPADADRGKVNPGSGGS
jgi:hypothetical protein